MDFEMSEEQQAFCDLATSFAGEQLAPYAAQWDRESFFPVETMRKAAELGFAGLYVRDDVGGTGLTRLDAALIFEALSRGCTSTAAFLSIHNMASWMIDAFGNEEQRKKWLPSLVRMDLVASYCLTEPGAGSDAAALRTKAVRDGDSYVLNGSKAFISGSGVSDVYVCMVRTGGAGPGGISCFVVEKDTPGISFGAQEKKMGWNSQPTATVVFDNAVVPVSHRIGKEGEGFTFAMKGLDGGRLNIGACSLGTAGSALDAARNYMKERKQFGRPLADFQALQFKLADMATELEAARLLLYQAADKVTRKTPDATKQAAMAKRFATDTGFRVANEALQIHGGYGYLQDFPLERHVRDLRVHQILEGTNEIMRVIIAREMMKE